MTPTAEQDHAVGPARAERSIAVVAGAGTGKTTTLALLAQNLQGRTCRYLAFNKAIVTDSAARFPDNVVCSTAHSLAFQATGRAFRRRLDTPRLPSDQIAALLGIDPLAIAVGKCTAGPVGRLSGRGDHAGRQNLRALRRPRTGRTSRGVYRRDRPARRFPARLGQQPCRAFPGRPGDAPRLGRPDPARRAAPYSQDYYLKAYHPASTPTRCSSTRPRTSPLSLPTLSPGKPTPS
ncbi:MAG: hypothetical protein M3083_12555 [Actinomycetota bacterium]|nr:hypothetical protein [Actinomycetota bacterium]